MVQFFKNVDYKELIFQAVFLVTLFFLNSFNKHNPSIELHEFVFFLHYVILASIINYVLFPRFFYTKKYPQFIIGLLFILGAAYIMEEFVLEKLFFHSGRAEHISNVFFTLLEIVPLLIIMVSFKLAWDAIKKHKQLEQLESTVKESELRYLKSQINPHFLFNNLNNLYSYAIDNSPKTPSIILELSSVLRYMLYECKENFVFLSKEIEHLKHFTALNELQIEERGNVEFTTKNNTDKYVIAPLILVIFIENAFKHSTASQSEDIEITIDIKTSNTGELCFMCKNSFLPKKNNQNLSKGIGLQNVKKRLHLLYPNKHQLKIEDFGTNYEVNLILQLQPKQ